MFKFITKIRSTLPIQLILVSFIFTFFSTIPKTSAGTFIPVTQTQVCNWLNNQNGSATDTNQETPPGDLQDKIAVITEEPMGPADNKFTFRCTRQIKCSAKNTKNNEAKDGKYIKIRECVTSYVTSCTPTVQANEIPPNLLAPDAKATSYTLCEPVMIYVSEGGTSMLYQYIGQVYRYVAGIGGILAVLMIVVAGIMMASAGDNADQIKKGKELAQKCIIGLVVLFLSAVILYTINPNFFVI